MRRSIAVMLCLGFLVTMAVHADTWPQFRGIDRTRPADESRLPAEWAMDKNIQWKMKLPGFGWSSPIIWGDKVFLTTAVSDKQNKPRSFGGFGGRAAGGERSRGERPPGGRSGGGFGGFGAKPPDALYRWEIYCLDRNTGKILWQQLAAERKPAIPTHGSNTYASETPATDGERVYAYFGMTGVYCHDLDGKFVWKKEDIGSYPMQFGWGTGSSPTLDGDRLFIQCDNEQKSFLIALDKKTGKELWRVDRPDKSAWCTPYVWRNKQRTELVTANGRRVRSYDPADGKMLWEYSGLFGQSNGASPIADDETLYFGCSSPFGAGPFFAIKAGGSGDLTLKKDETSSPYVPWYNPRGGPSMASPLLYNGYLYVFEQRTGQVSCYDAKTGKAAYNRQRLPGGRGFTSSPWAYDGKVFALDEDGKTFVLQAGPEFKVLAENKLDEMFWSSAAVAGGTLILRGVDNVYCVAK